MKLFHSIIVSFFVGQCFASEIHDLIKNGRVSDALVFLRAHPDQLDAKDDYECTPLHLASRFGTPALVDYLVSAGADLNSRSYNQFTPLHVCGSSVSAAALIRAGARTDLIDAWGDTALQALAQDKKADICAAMEKAGVQLDIVSMLYLDRREQAREIAKRDPSVLKQHIGTSNLFGNATPLGLAVRNGDFDTVKLFVSLGAPVNGESELPQTGGGPTTPVCTAIGRGNIEIAAYLLEHGAVLDGGIGKFYPRVLDYAIEHCDQPMKDLLFRYCRDPRLLDVSDKKRPNSDKDPASRKQ